MQGPGIEISRDDGVVTVTESRMSKPMAMVGRKHLALNSPAQEVTEWDESLVILARRMQATLSRLSGMALAAPQVGRGLKLVVAKSGGMETNPLVNIVIHPDGNLVSDVEGCLSIPGRWYEVERFQRCTVEGLNLREESVKFDVQGIAARMWQHEADHLDGLILHGRFPEIQRPQR
jgi:peptide deformylase